MDSSTPDSDILKLTIKCTSTPNFEVEVAKDASVKTLKELIEEKNGIPHDKQRLIFSGRIMKDEMSLTEYKIQNGNSVHLIKRSAAKTTQQSSGNPATGMPAPSSLSAGQETGNPLSDLTGARYSGLANLPPASIFGPDGGLGPAPTLEDTEELFNNPEQLSEILNHLSNLDENDPLLMTLPPDARRQFVEFSRSPIFQSILSDPNEMQLFRNAAQVAMQMDQSDLASLSQAAGINPFAAAAGSGSDAASNTPGNNESVNDDINQLQRLLGIPPIARTDSDARVNELLSFLRSRDAATPGASNPAMNNLFNLGLANPALTAAASRPPEEVYESQLRQLNELGFFDFDRNIKALRRSGGNLEGAIEALVENLV